MAKKEGSRNSTRYVVKIGKTTKHGGITERPLGERAGSNADISPHFIFKGA